MCMRRLLAAAVGAALGVTALAAQDVLTTLEVRPNQAGIVVLEVLDSGRPYHEVGKAVFLKATAESRVALVNGALDMGEGVHRVAGIREAVRGHATAGAGLSCRRPVRDCDAAEGVPGAVRDGRFRGEAGAMQEFGPLVLCGSGVRTEAGRLEETVPRREGAGRSRPRLRDQVAGRH